MDEETENLPIGRRLRLRLFLFLIAFLLVVGFLVIWFSRIDLANNLVRSELDQLDVQASYEISDIGFNKQVIRNLVLGDPASPDLTAELVEVGSSVSSSGAGINWVRAKGVKLFASYRGGKLSLGELDKFLDPNDESPLALPDIWLGVDRGQMRIDSDYGIIGISLNGEGNLQDGFDGEIAAISERLTFGDCRTSDPTFFGNVSISLGEPRIRGPLRLPASSCENLSVSAEDMAAQTSLRLTKDLASWEGSIGVVGGPLRYPDFDTSEIKSSISFSGNAEESKGVISLTASELEAPFATATVAQVEGPFAIGYGAEQVTASFRGDPAFESVRIGRRFLTQINSAAQSASGTPIGPVLKRFAIATAAAGQSIDVESSVRFTMGDRGSRVALNSLDMKSRSGASIALDDPLLLTFAQDGLAILADSHIVLNGGGMPDMRVTINDGSVSQGFSGQIEMAAYDAGTAKLNIPALLFSPSRNGGTDIDGRVILSGPLPDGQLTGLQVPVRGNVSSSGRISLFRECVEVKWTSVQASTLVAGPAGATICPESRSAIVSGNGSNLTITGRTSGIELVAAVDGTPLTLSTGNLSYSSTAGVTGQNLAFRYGETDSLTSFAIENFSVALGQIISGQISGASGQIASIPLLMKDVQGDWRLDDGMLLAEAALRVRDEQQVERFWPMISKNMKLAFVDGKITAEGTLLEPTTERQVASVDLNHTLENNAGEAILDVGWLTFDEQLQPGMLTPLTLGVIANVNGTVTGSGRINWDNSGDGVVSVGKFKTEGINLAAAFGPVTGLTGEIEFSDLLGLETAPGQWVRMAEVNPGVPAFNGMLSYRLLPDYKMQVEGGQWPFSGGMLYLEPTVLDLGEDAERRLEFSVVGVDAAQFLTKFEFENLSATGIFDGKLPMVFDQDGGRIAGGYLVARKGGGSLAYIGELTYEDMGTFANFAFNALKSLKYQELTIGMDGAIDGEIITEVKFAGLQQGDTASKNFVTKQLARIPLEFNVRIQAPFMQLMSSAKSFYEPELLVGQNLPALLRAREERAEEATKILKEQDE
ncbi:YdbH domain-containing protein [Parasphingorhabdus sp.]|uniref:intermembrane phospholipid transport protein YdbH family protein n=1 Tax=Parasphingorhabdus sp. TaxID=2709688 RepID=UPI003263BED7